MVALVKDRTASTQNRYAFTLPQENCPVTQIKGIDTVHSEPRYTVPAKLSTPLDRGTSSGFLLADPSKRRFEDANDLFQRFSSLRDWVIDASSEDRRGVYEHLDQTASNHDHTALGGHIIVRMVKRAEAKASYLQSGRISQATGGMSEAARMIGEIKKATDLTLEELAPLVGVTRRSLQHWLKGASISARKEKRLRELFTVLSDIAMEANGPLRPMLMARSPNQLSPYDLLASGRFDAVREIITGKTFEKSISSAASTNSLTLREQLSAIESGVPDLSQRRLDRRFSGRIKR